MFLLFRIEIICLPAKNKYCRVEIPVLATAGIDMALSYEVYKSAGCLFHCCPSSAGHCMWL